MGCGEGAGFVVFWASVTGDTFSGVPALHSLHLKLNKFQLPGSRRQNSKERRSSRVYILISTHSTSEPWPMEQETETRPKVEWLLLLLLLLPKGIKGRLFSKGQTSKQRLTACFREGTGLCLMAWPGPEQVVCGADSGRVGVLRTPTNHTHGRGRGLGNRPSPRHRRPTTHLA